MAMYQKKQKKNPTTESMKTINDQLESRSFSRVFLLFGDETYLINQYRDKLVKALTNEGDTMNFTSYGADNFSLDNVASDIITMPFLAEYRVVLVEDSGIFDKSDDELISYINQMGDQNILIFCEKKVDKRKKMYTTLSKMDTASCLEFAAMDIPTLTKWLGGILSDGGNIKVRATVADRLISAVGTDMTQLRNEAVKLRDYCMKRGEINDKDVDTICVNPVEDKVFEMCESIAKKDRDRAILLYTDLCTIKTKPMTIIFLVTRQYNQLIQVSHLLCENADSARIASSLKTPEFAARKLIGICKNYKHRELLAALDKCQDADLAVKTGRLTDVNAAENLIVNLLS